MQGKHCWRTWSSTQGAVALSAAEAEFYAMVDGVQRMKWAGTVSEELGIQVEDKVILLRTDSDAARSFVQRRGLGRMRHIEVRNLWLQEEVRLGRVKVERVSGKENAADLMTKYLKVEEVVERLGRMNLEWRQAGEVKGKQRWADIEDGGSGTEEGAVQQWRCFWYCIVDSCMGIGSCCGVSYLLVPYSCMLRVAVFAYYHGVQLMT